MKKLLSMILLVLATTISIQFTDESKIEAASNRIVYAFSKNGDDYYIDLDQSAVYPVEKGEDFMWIGWVIKNKVPSQFAAYTIIRNSIYFSKYDTDLICNIQEYGSHLIYQGPLYNYRDGQIVYDILYKESIEIKEKMKIAKEKAEFQRMKEDYEREIREDLDRDRLAKKAAAEKDHKGFFEKALEENDDKRAMDLINRAISIKEEPEYFELKAGIYDTMFMKSGSRNYNDNPLRKNRKENEKKTIYLYESRAKQKERSGDLLGALKDYLKMYKVSHYTTNFNETTHSKRKIKEISKTLGINYKPLLSKKYSYIFYLGKDRDEKIDKLIGELQNSNVQSSNDKNSEEYFKLGLNYENMKQYNKAIENYKKCIELAPNIEPGAADMIVDPKDENIDTLIDGNGSTLKVNEKHMLIYDDNKNYRGRLGRIYFKQKNYTEALKYLDEAINNYKADYFGDNSDENSQKGENNIYWLRGQCNEHLKNYEAALKDYEKSLEFEPENQNIIKAKQRVEKLLNKK